MTYVPEQKPEETGRTGRTGQSETSQKPERAERVERVEQAERGSEEPRTGAGAPRSKPVLGPDATAETASEPPATPVAPTPVTPQAGSPKGRLTPDPERGTGRPDGEVSARTDGSEPLIPLSEREKLSERLHQAVNAFVDGPRHAVEEADRVFEETVTRVTDTLTERRTSLRTAWNGREDEDHASATEELRVALRTYREVTERLLEL